MGVRCWYCSQNCGNHIDSSFSIDILLCQWHSFTPLWVWSCCREGVRGCCNDNEGYRRKWSHNSCIYAWSCFIRGRHSPPPFSRSRSEQGIYLAFYKFASIVFDLDHRWWHTMWRARHHLSWFDWPSWFIEFTASLTTSNFWHCTCSMI